MIAPVNYPIVYEADLPQQRNRLTVGLRFLTVIPILIVAIFYFIAAFFCVIVAWFALLFTGRYPDSLYGFVRGVLQFGARCNAYTYLQVDQYPPFDTGDHPEYPVRMQIPEDSGEHNRLTVLFRAILFIPVYIIQYAFSIAIYLVAIAMWFVALFTGKSNEGMHNALTFLLGYVNRSYAYMMLVTDKWPPISQDAAPAAATTGTLTSPPPPPPPPSTPGAQRAARRGGTAAAPAARRRRRRPRTTTHPPARSGRRPKRRGEPRSPAQARRLTPVPVEPGSSGAARSRAAPRRREGARAASRRSRR